MNIDSYNSVSSLKQRKKRTLVYVQEVNFSVPQKIKPKNPSLQTSVYLTAKKKAALAALNRKRSLFKRNFSDITLHHASPWDFDHFDLTKCNPLKDYGRAIYAGISEDRCIDLVKDKYGHKKNSRPTLYTFKLSTDLLKKLNCKVKVFNLANGEWLNYVMKHRLGEYDGEEYDLVKGPTLDGNTEYVKTLYAGGEPC